MHCFIQIKVQCHYIKNMIWQVYASRIFIGSVKKLQQQCMYFLQATFDLGIILSMMLFNQAMSYGNSAQMQMVNFQIFKN